MAIEFLAAVRNGGLEKILCSIIELDKGQEKISKHIFEKSFMFCNTETCRKLPVICLSMGMLVLRFLINGRLGNKLCSIIELDKGQEKISKHDFEKSFMYYNKVICHPVGLLVLRFLIKWLYLPEGIRIGWHHRKMATNPIYML